LPQKFVFIAHNQLFAVKLKKYYLRKRSNKGFKDVSGTADYTFYDDGSLKSDNNRGISLIEYNYMGLPDIIHFGSTKRIENVYDADGFKLSQKLVNGSATITTDYMGDLIYRNDSLKTILHDEGRIAYQNDNAYIYQFFIYDHLGNTRAIVQRLNATTALVQENHYGVWGEVLEGIGTQGDWNFLYQGKEFISDYGYDFHARSYDTWSGRFDGIDPVDNYSISGYAGMMNNPLSYIDPDGRLPILVFVGAAVIGGGSNLWSNWGKVKNFKQGLAYFASGAVGGAVSVVNPVLGGSITAGGNLVTDVATGNIPKFNNGWDVAKYAGGLALDGLGAGGAGSLSKFGYSKLASYFSASATVSMAGSNGATIIERFAGAGLDDIALSYMANYEIMVKPAVKGVGNTLGSQIARHGLNYSDDASRVIRAVPEYSTAWSSSTVRNAAKEISEGATDIYVKNRGQAEELLHNLYTGKGFSNTSGWNPLEAKSWFRNGGHYHWDDVFDSAGRLVGHGANNPHGAIPHLQIHDKGNRILRIFFR
jgi:RHS repeat-associated protein